MGFFQTERHLRIIMNTDDQIQRDLNDIGTRLVAIRRKKGFSTSKEFATKFNLPAIQYWKMENGKANITLKSLLRILAIHKMSVEEFFCEDIKKAAA
jgi:transcriptional regulator with XRE-family HTH domain